MMTLATSFARFFLSCLMHAKKQKNQTKKSDQINKNQSKTSTPPRSVSELGCREHIDVKLTQ